MKTYPDSSICPPSLFPLILQELPGTYYSPLLDLRLPVLQLFNLFLSFKDLKTIVKFEIVF